MPLQKNRRECRRAAYQYYNGGSGAFLQRTEDCPGSCRDYPEQNPDICKRKQVMKFFSNYILLRYCKPGLQYAGVEECIFTLKENRDKKGRQQPQDAQGEACIRRIPASQRHRRTAVFRTALYDCYLLFGGGQSNQRPVCISG